jgi:hypothetical protein
MLKLINLLLQRKQASVNSVTKVATIEELRNKIIEHYTTPIVDSIYIHGSSASELQAVEDEFGILPTIYKDIMQLMGKKIEWTYKSDARFEVITCPKDWEFYLDEIIDLNRRVFTLESHKEIEEGSGYPDNTFLIYSPGTDSVYFILANVITDDSAVYIDRYDRMSNSIEDYTKIYDSLWDWIDDYIQNKI